MSKSVKKFLITCSRQCGYNERLKAQYHREAKLVAKELAKHLGLSPEDYDLRSNKGGPAVRGEVTLHSDSLYVDFNEVIQGNFMWRTCNGRRDYTGNMNRWEPLTSLLDMERLAKKMHLAEEQDHVGQSSLRTHVPPKDQQLDHVQAPQNAACEAHG